MNEKICRLCLHTKSENYQELGETLKDILKLNLGKSKETATCIECTNNLHVFFNLKSACADMRARMLSSADLKNDVSLNPVKIEDTNSLEPVMEPKNKIRCSFCTKSTEKEDLILLHESKENIFLVDIVKKFIPELNLNNIGEVLTCEICLDGMQIVSNFLKKCTDVEEKISKYVEIQGTDDKGQIDLQKVQQFIIRPMLKFEDESCNLSDRLYDPVQEEVTMKAEDELTYKIEEDNLESFIKTEDVDIKSASSDYDSSQESSAKTKLDNEHKNSLDMTVYKCDICTYETLDKIHLDDHILTHKNRLTREMFDAFETEYKQYLNQHKLTTESSLEITKFKCELCEYETEYKDYLKSHMLTHKTPSKITMYKCDTCTFETIRKCNLAYHKLIHKNPSEITMFKCEMCTFEAKRKHDLTRHMLTHKNPSEVTKFKCEMCPFETIHRYDLKKHMLIHKHLSELTMYKCEICTLETIHKGNLTTHKLIHKSASEITMFKCEMCTFEVKHKRFLKRHMLTHKDSSDVTKVKCGRCPFETIHKYDLKKHMLIHKSLSELTMYKCEMCAFETIYKGNLTTHKLIHKSPLEITMFKCAICMFEVKRKRDLKRHMLTHKNPSEVTKVKCETCPFETKHKYDLKKHMLIHKHPSEVI